jgi:hypothetical protein
MTALRQALGPGARPVHVDRLAAGSSLLDPGRTGFPRRPRMAPGDRLVLYASGWRCVFGVAEVLDEPSTDDPTPANPQRWPWSVPVELLIVVPLLSNAPPVEAIGVSPRSMSQQSHIRLEPRHLELAVEALAGVGRAGPPI